MPTLPGMARRKNPRYRPMPPGWRQDKPSTGAHMLSGPATPPLLLEKPVYPKPWIESPLSRPQADMLRAAASGKVLARAGRVSIDGRYASVVTLRSLRQRGLLTSVGVHLTACGREAICFHRLQE